MTKKIILIGTGGQGIKLASKVLGDIFVFLGYEVSVMPKYDAPQRGGKIYTQIIFSDKKITNPIIDKADLTLLMSQIDFIPASKKYVADRSLGNEKYELCPIIETAENLGSKLSQNMVAIGILLKKLQIDIKKINYKKVLPTKFFEINKKAIVAGYNLACHSER